ncbi:MAG: type II toxin-antitoxin system Phd/YefM family antitoxin [Bacteroidales bacterium]|nr:type II toxin-antitoxin system Phd/YefM family antitoxin [Bacteroidales bacterium]
MQPILASFFASISELKKNPIALLNQANGEVVAILNHNHPMAYLVPAEQYEQLMERLEDYELGEIVTVRQSEKAHAIEVELDDL